MTTMIKIGEVEYKIIKRADEKFYVGRIFYDEFGIDGGYIEGPFDTYETAEAWLIRGPARSRPSPMGEAGEP
jgi:hypothetical protein